MTFTEVITLTKIECGNCGGLYAISERFRQNKYDHAGTWHCPYCQCSWGYVKTEAARLREQLDARGVELHRAQQQAANDRMAREAAEKLALKERRKSARAANGVCTCCNRSFTNLRRHMATKHGAPLKRGEKAPVAA